MFKTLIAATIAAGFSSTVLAAGGGEAGSLLSWEMLYKTVNFLLLLYLLNRFAKKPIVKMLSTSAEKTKHTIDEAKAELAAAKQKLEDYQSKLDNLEKELEERRQKALAAIDNEKKQLIQDAEDQVKKLEKQSQERIEQDILKAKYEIREFLVNESVKMAEETIAKEIGSKERKALLDNYAKFIKETA